MGTDIEDVIVNAVIEGDIKNIGDLIKNGLEKEDPDALLKLLIKGMEEVGDKFESKEYFVPEVLLSAHTMQKGLEILRTKLFESETTSKGRVVIGSVEGDIHDIGKNLVGMFLEGAGFEVHNLGRDVPIEVFLEKVQELKPDVVALSAMMSTTVERMREVLEEFKNRGLDQDIKFIVGGAAISDAYAKQIGANGYASDAKKALRLFEEILGAMKEKYDS